MSDECTITPREDGPLVVKEPPRIYDHSGAELETRKVAALCRCGASKNKPFCDGSHNEIGFSSTPDHSKLRNKAIDYSGDVDGVPVTISYTPVLCSHAGECAKRAGAVFQPSEKPWIKPENGTLSNILDVMAACPSGALRVSIGEGSEQHLSSPNVEIRVEEHGPYWVRNVKLDGVFNGVGASRSKYVLCRCGQSKNKPFCDGTHHDIQWRDDATSDAAS